VIDKSKLVETKEGLAKILIPNPKLYTRPDGIYEPSWAPVFYNPQMAFNRDIAVLFLRSVKTQLKKLVVYEPLAGTGVRGIRIALEVGDVEELVMNDINIGAYELMRINVELNNLTNITRLENKDANALMFEDYAKDLKASYIDIDPFGSPANYVQSSLLLVKRGGYVAYTATDLAPLTGKYPLKALRRYQVHIMRTDFEKELAIRSLISYIVRRGAELDIALQPVLAYYTDHYIRAYFKVDKGAMKSINTLKNLGYILYCPNCLYRDIITQYLIPSGFETRCPLCKSEAMILGPLWIGKLACKEVVEDMINELERTKWLVAFTRATKLLTTILSEIDIEIPYYRVDTLCSRLKTYMPKISELIECIESEGYRAKRTHFDERGVKTNAPLSIIKQCIKSLRSD